MATLNVIYQGHSFRLELARVPVAGDLIAKGNDPIEVGKVILVGPQAPFDAIIVCDDAQGSLAAGVQGALDEAAVRTEGNG